MFLKKLLFISIFYSYIYSNDCSPYFNPERFYDAPEYLEVILMQNNKKKDLRKFTIEKKELYKFTADDIANDVNNNFGGFWKDWIEDGYEMQLVPEQTLFRYKKNYFSLEVLIYGVVGDATKLNGTEVIYKFFNYTDEVNKHIKCKKIKLKQR